MSDKPAEQSGKKPWESKTLWLNLALALLYFAGQNVELIRAIAGEHYHEAAVCGIALANAILRLITAEPIILKARDG